jgi:hypothetical protein
MSNGSRLSIPQLEDQIARLAGELRARQAREPEIRWYRCTRCSSFYTSIWGCGCPLYPGEKRQAAPAGEQSPDADLLADLRHRAAYLRQLEITKLRISELAEDVAAELDRAIAALARSALGTSNEQPRGPQ